MPTDLHADPPVRLAEPEQPHTALIFCHGRGATPESLRPLVRVLERPGVLVLAPRASAINGMPQWYPNSFLAPLEANEPGLSAGLEAVGRAVEEVHAMGLADEQIVLGGFSQGACLAAEYAARHARRWGGVAVLSGALIGTAEADDPTPSLSGVGGRFAGKRFDYEGSFAKTSVLLACAEQDAHIPAERVRRSAEVFRAMGADVDLRIYPGSTHAVVDDEVQYLRGLLEYLAC